MVETQESFKNIKIKKIVEVNDNDKTARVTPFDQTMITCSVEYPTNALVSNQFHLLFLQKYTKLRFVHRTFGFLKDVNKLKEKGLIKGGSRKMQ